RENLFNNPISRRAEVKHVLTGNFEGFIAIFFAKCFQQAKTLIVGKLWGRFGSENILCDCSSCRTNKARIMQKHFGRHSVVCSVLRRPMLVTSGLFSYCPTPHMACNATIVMEDLNCGASLSDVNVVAHMLVRD